MRSVRVWLRPLGSTCQSEQLSGRSTEDFLFVVVRDFQLLDDVHGALERYWHRRKITAVNYMVDADGIHRALHSGRMQRNGVEIKLCNVTRRRARHDIRFPRTEAHVFPKLVAESIASWQHRQRATDVGTDYFEFRKFFKAAREDEAGQRQRRVERSTEHLGQPEYFHLFVADGELQRMNEDRHVEITDQFEKRCRPRRVEILAVDTGVDHNTFEFVLADRAFGFFENLAVIERHGTGETEQALRMF